MPALPARDLTAVRALMTDFPAFARTLLRIKTKDRRIVPFVLNPEQQILWEDVQAQMRDGLPVRLAVLKPRQIGASTFGQGLVFSRVVTVPNTHGMTIAHDMDSTKRIYEIGQVFYDYMPVKPMARFSTRYEMVFENPDDAARARAPGLRSRLEIRTAGKMSAGRGLMIHALHCSELSSWPYPEEIWTAISQTVPSEPGTVIVMESTALGAGDWWHEFYQSCKDPDSPFIARFIPWFTVREYELSSRLTRRWLDVRALDTEEKRLKRLYHLSDGRLAWRRMKIKEMKDRTDDFMREYPACEEDAWVVANEPVFNAYRLSLALERARPPAARGYLDGALAWHDDGRGPLRVWDPPRQGTRYILAADVALGVPGGDFSCMQVLDQEDAQVACWWGHVEPIAFAHEIEKVARYYHHALVAIEIQNHGYATMAELRTTYFNQFQWRYHDRVADHITKQLGWQTNPKSKQLLLSYMAHLIESGDVGLRDRDTIVELMRYVYHGNGETGAAPGYHDDRAMAMMIACWVSHLERPRGSRGGVVLPPDWAAFLPEEARRDPDFALTHDLGQHFPAARDAVPDWRVL